MSTELIPAGKYRARAKSWDLGKTDTAKEQVAISFVLSDPEFNGAMLPWYGYFTDAALETTVRALRACGWAGIDLEDLSGLDANEVNLVVEHEEYNGQVRSRVRWVNSIGVGLVKTALDGAEKKSFAQRMRGAIAAVDQGAPRPKAPSRQPEPPPHTDKDNPLPF